MRRVVWKQIQTWFRPIIGFCKSEYNEIKNNGLRVVQWNGGESEQKGESPILKPKRVGCKQKKETENMKNNKTDVGARTQVLKVKGACFNHWGGDTSVD